MKFCISLNEDNISNGLLKLNFTGLIIVPIIVNICWQEKKTLECSTGGNTINILYADYGRFDLTSCSPNSQTDQNCGTANAWNVIINKCQSKKTCSIKYDNAIAALFNVDPCVGVRKYIKVVYQCTGIYSMFHYTILLLGNMKYVK